MSTEFKLPTETVELPSKGLLYDEKNPLSKGTVEIKYMTAKEEDILTNANYISNGTVIDKLLKSLIVDKNVKYDDILIGDKNAIMIASRILAYGKDYKVQYGGQEYDIDLSKMQNKYLDESLIVDGKNEFSFDLPQTGNTVKFRLLTHIDEKNIDREVEGRKKMDKLSSTLVTTRFKHIITEVNGKREAKDIRNFVDNYLLTQDSKALRDYYGEISPDLDLTYKGDDQNGNPIEFIVPIGTNFFWPE